ncbi:MAG: hypothetical protein GWN87_08310, partial [Desulfuromonadales bacterium]|nr:hypothetical protein [Desulfuromonadales bacterium]
MRLRDDEWQLDREVDFQASLDPRSLGIAPHCWRHDGASVCLGPISIYADRGSLDVEFRRVPIRTGDVPLLIVDAEASPVMSVSTRLTGDLEAAFRQGVVRAAFEA